jgi:aspartyl-tRNA(Asn)/glutamyl-tRNA(Gln) amidotransferase subunit B
MVLKVTPDKINGVRIKMPELPDACSARFVSQYGLPEYDAGVLTESRDTALYFEDAVKVHNNPKALSNWTMTEVLRIVKEGEGDIAMVKVTPGHLAGMIKLIDDGVISGKIAKTVFEEMAKSGQAPEAIVKARGLTQVTDKGEIDGVVKGVLAENPSQVAAYKGGKTKVFGFFVGAVMKKTKGKANPRLVNELLKKALTIVLLAVFTAFSFNGGGGTLSAHSDSVSTAQAAADTLAPEDQSYRIIKRNIEPADQIKIGTAVMVFIIVVMALSNNYNPE